MSEEAAESKRPTRASAWKVIGLVFSSLVLMLVVLFIWVSVVGNRRFAAMEKKLSEMVAETEAVFLGASVEFDTTSPQGRSARVD